MFYADVIFLCVYFLCEYTVCVYMYTCIHRQNEEAGGADDHVALSLSLSGMWLPTLLEGPAVPQRWRREGRLCLCLLIDGDMEEVRSPSMFPIGSHPAQQGRT